MSTVSGALGCFECITEGQLSGIGRKESNEEKMHPKAAKACKTRARSESVSQNASKVEIERSLQGRCRCYTHVCMTYERIVPLT